MGRRRFGTTSAFATRARTFSRAVSRFRWKSRLSPAVTRSRPSASRRLSASAARREPRAVVEPLDEGEVDEELGPRGDLVDVLAAGAARADAPRLEGGGGDPHAGGDVDGVGHGRAIVTQADGERAGRRAVR